jgi:nucleoside-diphosphate-sugar epimerase
MKILVTGSRGYIGVPLCQALQNAGHEVTGIDLGLYFDYELIFRHDWREYIQDFRVLTTEQLRGFDAVFHLAALSNDPMGKLNPNLTLDLNGIQTIKLAEKCKAAKIPRFIFSSSAAVYGIQEGLVDEHTVPQPLTEYAKAKLFAEEGLVKLADETFCPICLRNGTVYGWSPSMRFDLVVNNLTAQCYFENVIKLHGSGKVWRPLIHIQDLIAQFIACLNYLARYVKGEVFNNCFNAANYQVLDVAKIIQDLFQASHPQLIIENKEVDERSYQLDCSKLDLMVLDRPQRHWDVLRGVKDILFHLSRTTWTLDQWQRGKIGVRLKQLDLSKLELK